MTISQLNVPQGLVLMKIFFISYTLIYVGGEVGYNAFQVSTLYEQCTNILPLYKCTKLDSTGFKAIYSLNKFTTAIVNNTQAKVREVVKTAARHVPPPTPSSRGRL